MAIRNKILRVENVVVVTLFIIVATLTRGIGVYDNVKMSGSYTLEFFTKWKVTYADGESSVQQAPIILDEKRNETITLEYKLPNDIKSGSAIMMYTGYSKCEIYVNGQEINTFAKNPHLPFGRLIGNVRLITELKPEYAGSTLVVKMTPMYNARLDFKKVYYGSMDALKFHVLYTNLWQLLVCTALAVLVLMCLGLSIYRMVKRIVGYSWGFYHLGMFVLFTQIWIFCDSDLPQIFFNQTDTASFMSFVALAIMPIHYVAFCMELMPKNRKFFQYMQIVLWLVPFFEIACFALNIADPIDITGRSFSLLRLNHISIGVVALTSIIKSVKYHSQSKFFRLFSVANLCLALSVIVAFVFFYIAPTGNGASLTLCCGMIVFTFMLFTIVLNMEGKVIEDARAKDLYMELAFKDVQTGLYNRTAYNEYCENIRTTGAKIVDIVIMDINSLKWVNDNLGHLSGDSLIINAARCVQNAFADIGKCYRIGGDEFAVVILDNHDRVDGALDRMNYCIQEVNAKHKDFELSISVGKASDVYSSLPLFMEKLFTQADKAMYKNKRKWHKEHKKMDRD